MLKRMALLLTAGVLLAVGGCLTTMAQTVADGFLSQVGADAWAQLSGAPV